LERRDYAREASSRRQEFVLHQHIPGRGYPDQLIWGLNGSPSSDCLDQMPRSCNIVFDVLRAWSMYPATISVRELAAMTHLSRAQVARALRRLEGAKLIKCIKQGSGTRPSSWKVLWSFPQLSVSPRCASLEGVCDDTENPVRDEDSGEKEGSFPQASVSRTREFIYPEKEKPSHTERNPPCPVSPSLPVKGEVPRSSIEDRGTGASRNLGPRALRWAMSRIREEVRTYPISWERRDRILEGIGVALRRALRRGDIRTRIQLRRVVSHVIVLLREAEGISEDRRRACAWGDWELLGFAVGSGLWSHGGSRNEGSRMERVQEARSVHLAGCAVPVL